MEMDSTKTDRYLSYKQKKQKRERERERRRRERGGRRGYRDIVVLSFFSCAWDIIP
jgi:hypothetical protein